MKKRLLLAFMVFTIGAHAQQINVSTSQYTVPELVQQVLFGNTATSCFSGQISNVSWRTGSNFGTVNGIGYFSNINPDFPIASGVILSTGNVLNAQGPNTSTQGGGNWVGDTDLQSYIQGLGIDSGLTNYHDATVLEFDFTPYVSHISFDFLFASEEYGSFQCSYSDAFAFFLTDVTAGTPSENIALVPGTTTPISVVTIRDNAYNVSCASHNLMYFGNYNGGAAAATAATNFNGETAVMTAASDVIPNHVYHIKLVIADRNDNNYDSAVFLKAGSFNFGIEPLQGTGPFVGLTELIDVCPDQTITIQAGNYNIPNVTYSWSQDGISLPAITTPTLAVTQSGTYAVTITGPNGCEITSDTMIISYTPAFSLDEPIDLESTTGTFDLTSNIPLMLNGQLPGDYLFSFHTSQQDAQNLLYPIANPNAYAGTAGEIIYVAIEGVQSGCLETKSFMLNPPPAPSNDWCANAVTLPVGNSFDDFPVMTTNFAATNDSFNENSFCDGNFAARDIWFNITVPSTGNVTIETQGNGGLTDTVLEAFSSCGSTISIGCNNDYDSTNKTANLYSKLELTNLTPGQNIVLRAFGKAESQGSFAIGAYDSALSNQEIKGVKLAYYPVPVLNTLTITNIQDISSVVVYDMLGQKLITQITNAKEVAVDMVGLQAAIYLVKVNTEKGSETFRVIKK